MSDRYRVSPADTITKRNSKAMLFQGRLHRRIRRLNVSSAKQRKLLTLIGLGRCTEAILLSDATARLEASNILCKVVGEFFEGNVPANTPMYHLTFADDIGLSSDRLSVFRLRALRRKVDKALRALALNALAVIEVQPLVNYPQRGRGRTLMLHAHALCWGGMSRRKFRNARRKLNRSRSWSNSFGALPIHSRQLKRGADDAQLIASYIAKLPYDAKRRVPQGRHNGEFRFRPTVKGYTDRLALRIIEGLSQYTIFDAVFGVCDGKHIRKEWKARLTEWQRERVMRCGESSPFDVAALWEKVHKRVGPPEYLPFVIE